MAKIEGDLKREAAVQLQGLSYVFEMAINNAFGDIADELKRQIQENVYNKWFAPPDEPLEYERRYEDGGIIDVGRYFTMSGLSHELGGPDKDISVSYEFSYEPSGQQWQWENPLDENELIHRIESGSGYEWKTYDPPQRPFWKPFVESWYQQGAVSNALESALRKLLQGEGYDGPVTIEYQHGDGDYSY